MLLNPGNPRTCEDDLESFVHVLVYTCLWFMTYSYSQPQILLQQYMDELYGAVSEGGDNHPTGGEYKRMFSLLPEYIHDLTFANNTPLTELIVDPRMLFHSRCAWNAEAFRPGGMKRHLRQLILAEDVLECFNRSLDKPGWPTEDKADNQLKVRDPLHEFLEKTIHKTEDAFQADVNPLVDIAASTMPIAVNTHQI